MRINRFIMRIIIISDQLQSDLQLSNMFSGVVYWDRWSPWIPAWEWLKAMTV